ncbi:MAG TPA: hypothetical protein VFK26_03460, partial [Gemmatimonadaceae bacterium]|nr:hypothetical protein [Gemmatimonadaceae bacterium]
EWGVTTQRGDTVFVHVLNWPDRVLSIPGFGRKILRATMLHDGSPVDVVSAKGALTLTMPTPASEQPDRVIVLVTSHT